jgi:hypothetical protein
MEARQSLRRGQAHRSFSHPRPLIVIWILRDVSFWTVMLFVGRGVDLSPQLAVFVWPPTKVPHGQYLNSALIPRIPSSTMVLVGQCSSCHYTSSHTRLPFFLAIAVSPSRSLIVLRAAVLVVAWSGDRGDSGLTQTRFVSPNASANQFPKPLERWGNKEDISRTSLRMLCQG